MHVICIMCMYNHNVLFYHYTQPCPIVITDTDNTPPVDNYTVNIVGLLSVDVFVGTCDYTTPVSEGNIYTVEMSVNNVIGSNKTTAGQFITISEIRLLFFLFSNSHQLA